MLSLSSMDALQEKFRQYFPCEVLHEGNTPARDFIRRIRHQQNQGCLEWLPWTNIVSVQQAQRMLPQKGLPCRRRSALTDQAMLLHIVEDELFLNENGVTGSPHVVCAFLETRRHAFAMLGLAHLGYLKDLDVRMLNAYTKRYTPEFGLRPVNLKELSSMDQVIWTDLYRMSRAPNWTIGRAIDDVMQSGRVDRELAGRPVITRSQIEAVTGHRQGGKGDNNRNNDSNTNQKRRRTQTPEQQDSGKSSTQTTKVKGKGKGGKTKGPGQKAWSGRTRR